MPTTRAAVYAAINGERRYQGKWQKSDSKGEHSFSEWFAYMEDYIDEAQHILAREMEQDAYPKVTHIMRKVTAMGVAAMEQLGAPQRPGYEEDIPF